MYDSTAHEEASSMLPPNTDAKPEMTNTGIYMRKDLLGRIQAIAEERRLKSPNKLMGSLLLFSVDLYSLLRRLEPQIKAFISERNCTDAEGYALLIELGLKSLKTKK